MEMYAPTRQERERWIQIFQAISEMNKKLISTRDMNPFKYIKDQQELNSS